MAKQFTKPAGRAAARPKRKVEVSDGVRVVMAGLSPGEKAAVEAAFRSVTALRRLPVESVVRAPSGDLYTARVTDDLRLVYRTQPAGLYVTDLLSAGAVRFLLHPGWAVRHERAGEEPRLKPPGSGAVTRVKRPPGDSPET